MVDPITAGISALASTLFSSASAWGPLAAGAGAAAVLGKSKIQGNLLSKTDEAPEGAPPPPTPAGRKPETKDVQRSFLSGVTGGAAAGGSRRTGSFGNQTFSGKTLLGQ